MPGIPLWSLREDVHLEKDPTGDVTVLHSRWGDIGVTGKDALVYECLRRMSFGPVSLENLLGAADGTSEAATIGRRARLHYVLERIQPLVVRSLGMEDAKQPLLSVVAVSQHARFELRAVDPATPLRLSRFATLRAQDGRLLMESPIALHRVAFHRPEAAWVVALLATPTTLDELGAPGALDSDLLSDIMCYLAAAGLVVLGEQDDAGAMTFPEDDDPALFTWNATELQFHVQSRLGRHDGDFGATFPHVGRLPPEPAVKEPPDGKRIPLYRPALEDILPTDPALTTALETRRSIRRYGKRPISLRQIGEFLYRVARVRSVHSRVGVPPATYEVSNRPYPSGGAAHEMEFYLTVGKCEGLEPGNYYYSPYGHCLVHLGGDEQTVGELIADSQALAGMTAPPQVLITYTARFRRLSWKYSGMWYALALKHVGVVQQTMCLVATAMRLAATPLGAGDIDTSSRAFGLDWREESSVGELALGSLPPDDECTTWCCAAEAHPVNDPEWAEHCLATGSPRTNVSGNLPPESSSVQNRR
ncbi:SagB family peptide dehydrogenase [Streptomyces sp. RB6PN25]|uniref:SagB family peptide dehydrogenase n=1 Tax=Streptomyces humicola TaxID=2953240 RepID=A0ABT1Q2X9_9ACTN|nr:SagB family peptide dehydrogenase [Streptomyces humicola]MCQ4084274.1 SagB family peptide dehydrogenase [Streptomyces humicola]